MAIIDEVRITNAPLSPSQFLFAPPGTALDGDYNDNDVVDAADYVVWRENEEPTIRCRTTTA